MTTKIATTITTSAAKGAAGRQAGTRRCSPPDARRQPRASPITCRRGNEGVSRGAQVAKQAW